VANLVDEPYCMSLDDVAKLTMRQVVLIYFRERDRKTGVPHKIDPNWETEIDEEIEAYQQFVQIHSFLGKSPDQINLEWERQKNGDSSGQS